MFAQDRDLLVMEPRLFGEVGFLSQTLGMGTGALTGGVVTSSGVDLVARGVAPGHVLVLGEVAMEVVEVLSSSTARVSLVRGDPASPIVAPAEVASGTPMVVRTFRPQLDDVASLLLVLVGVGDLLGSSPPTPAQVTNAPALRRVTALGALQRVYAAASSLVSADHPFVRKSESYRRAFNAERGAAVVELDLNGDGIADVRRRLSAVRFVRV